MAGKLKVIGDPGHTVLWGDMGNSSRGAPGAVEGRGGQRAAVEGAGEHNARARGKEAPQGSTLHMVQQQGCLGVGGRHAVQYSEGRHSSSWSPWPLLLWLEGCAIPSY